MTLSQKTDFNPVNPLILLIILVLAMFQAAFALQVEAPREFAEAVLTYSKEAGAENRDVILRVSTVKNEDCNAFAIKLINSGNGKVIKEIECCLTSMPNAALQSGILEIFGHPVKKESGVGGGVKTVLMGIGFAAAGILLYYTKPPEPVYIYKEVSK
ncbi:MAG: hypothetical protein LBB36_04830 [Fibromonadaceae bacterium]|jgi:hypothetical protein|nr:hypothetical protein [Fibromonadaceae bacterium]